MLNSKFKIIDTTLRDGSYAINFAFTSTQTYLISRELEKAGVEYIEVAHGVGLNASNCGHGQAVQTDKEYIQAAVKDSKNAKIGVFCIPGIARLEDIDAAFDAGIKFIRIGTNVTEVEQSEKFIKRAKNKGIEVFANYMKSYALNPREFAKKVKLSECYGADGVYIVDSSGGMFKEDIKNYFEAIREVSKIPVGFHAHDNLGLAISNNLEAIEMGIDFVDTSLQGLGRSSGNAATELLVAALIKKNYKLDIDYIKLMEIGHKYIIPLLTSLGRQPLDVVSGFADFHSSYMGYIQKYSTKYSINPLLLIIEITKADKVNINEKVLDKLAKKIKLQETVSLDTYNFNRYFGHEQN